MHLTREKQRNRETEKQRNRETERQKDKSQKYFFFFNLLSLDRKKSFK